MRIRRYYECYLCGKYSRDIVVAYIDGDNRVVCIRCFIPYILHETIRDMLRNGSEEELRYVLRVLEGLNDLVENHPLAQAIRYIVDTWAQRFPKPLRKSTLETSWRYRLRLNKVLSYLASEGILVESRLQGSSSIVISPGPLLRDLLKKFPTSRGFFQDVVRAVTGLAIVRYLADAETRKIRSVYATLQALAECLDDSLKSPVYKIKGDKCRICDRIYSLKVEIKTHLLKEHAYKVNCDLNKEECFNQMVETITGEKIGVWCRLNLFISKAGVYGISNLSRYLRSLLTRGVIIPQEEEEIVVERNGEKFVAVDIAWIKVRERMRMLERQLVRPRARI